MNFHRNTNSDRRSTRVTHEAKATSAGSTDGSGLLGSVFGRRSAAMPVVSHGAKGSSAPAPRRLRTTLATLALAIAAFAITAAPASADSAEMISASDPSYTTVLVKGKVTLNGAFNHYFFEYSTDNATWTPGPDNFGFNPVQGEKEEVLTVPKGGTKYFIRLRTGVDGFGEKTISPEPNPTVTTLAVDPPVILATDDASGVFSQSAQVSGEVERPANPDPAFNVTACRFELVSDADFKATGFQNATKPDCEQPPTLPFEAPEGKTDVTAHLAGLEPSTTYHLRLAAENAAPVAATKDATSTFTTTAKVAAPTVLTANDATEVGKKRPKSPVASNAPPAPTQPSTSNAASNTSPRTNGKPMPIPFPRSPPRLPAPRTRSPARTPAIPRSPPLSALN